MELLDDRGARTALCWLRRVFDGVIPVRQLICALIVGLFVIVGDLASSEPPEQHAILVEAHALPGCAGFDCPPWKTPLDFDVCVRVDHDYYAGMYRPWKGPWARNTNPQILEGKPVGVVVSAKYLRLLAPGIDLRLKRLYGAKGFRIPACNNLSGATAVENPGEG